MRYVALWVRSWLALALNLFLQLSLVPMPQTSRGQSMEVARAQHPTAVDRIHSSVVLSPSCNRGSSLETWTAEIACSFLHAKGSGPGPQDLIGKRRANSSGFGLGLGTFIWDLHGLAAWHSSRSPAPHGTEVSCPQVKPLRSWTHWVEWSLPEWFGMAMDGHGWPVTATSTGWKSWCFVFVFGWFGQIWASPMTSNIFIYPLWWWKICIPSVSHVKRLSERLDASSWDEDAPLWFRSETGHLQRAWWSGGWLCGTRRHGSLMVFVRVVSDSLILLVCRCRSLAVSQEMKWTWGSCPVLILSLIGTQFAPPRLYGYTQWAVQKFTKQARPQVRLWEGITSAAWDPRCGTLPNHQPFISHFGVTINHCKSAPAEVCDILIYSHIFSIFPDNIMSYLIYHNI